VYSQGPESILGNLPSGERLPQTTERGHVWEKGKKKRYAESRASYGEEFSAGGNCAVKGGDEPKLKHNRGGLKEISRVVFADQQKPSNRIIKAKRSSVPTGGVYSKGVRHRGKTLNLGLQAP